jgi:hypothetical protein
VARQERVVRLRHHIDDGVADAENVEAYGHDVAFNVMGKKV